MSNHKRGKNINFWPLTIEIPFSLVKNQKGQAALFLVLLMVLIIFLIGQAALSLGATARKNATLETNQKKAYYIAEAGVEKALAHYPALGSFPGINSLDYAGGVIESVSVAKVEGSPDQYKITSVGHYPKNGPAGIKAIKRLEVTAQTVTHYSGSASSKILNIGAIPGVLLDVTAGKSEVKVDTKGENTNHYAEAKGTPLEVKLLNGSLLEGLLTVTSVGNEGKKEGGINPENLPVLLKDLGLTVGVLTAGADSSTTPPRAESSSGVASLKLGPVLHFPEILEAGLIKTKSSLKPDFASGTLESSSGIVEDEPVNIFFLGDTLKIEGLRVRATAKVNDKPGGAKADFDWSADKIILKDPITGEEKSILSELKAQSEVSLPGVLKVSLGQEQEVANLDGTYAKASGHALKVQFLGSLLDGVIIEIGNAGAEAKVPPGGLIPCKIASWKEK